MNKDHIINFTVDFAQLLENVECPICSENAILRQSTSEIDIIDCSNCGMILYEKRINYDQKFIINVS